MPKHLCQLLLLAATLASVGAAHAFETMNRIRADGAVRVGLLAADDGVAERERLDRLAAFLGVGATIITDARADRLIAALAGGQLDLIASPTDLARPLPDSLAFTHAVDQANLAILGTAEPFTVQFGSDAWHRAVALREGGDPIALRISTRPAVDGALVFGPPGEHRAGRILAARQPRAWVHRSDDRVLGFKLNRFIHSEALRQDAVSHASVPPAQLLRASLRGEALTPWDELAQEQGRFHGLDWRLLLAVMYKESRFDPDAVSRSGALGLMQLKPIAAQEVGLAHFEAPADNVLAGARYLAWVLERIDPTLEPTERVWLALAAYNAGLTNVRRAQAHAQANGRDPGRWFGHVEHSLLEIARHREKPDGPTVVRYVRDIRDQLATYMRVTEGLGPRVLRATGPAVAASP